VVNHTRASSRRDRSRRKLYPNPIGSGTSCHKPISAGGWSSLRRRCALHSRDIHRFAWPGHAFAKPRRLGPPHTPPREGKRIPPHPRCLLSTGLPPKGFALATSVLCYQEHGGAKSWRLCIHRAFLSPDWAEDRNDSEPPGDHTLKSVSYHCSPAAPPSTSAFGPIRSQMCRRIDRSSPAHRAEVAFCVAFAAGGQAPFGAQPAEISRVRGFWW
jgi:hypothetical protein